MKIRLKAAVQCDYQLKKKKMMNNQKKMVMNKKKKNDDNEEEEQQQWKNKQERKRKKGEPLVPFFPSISYYLGFYIRWAKV